MRDLGDAITLASLEDKLIELVVLVKHEDETCRYMDARVSTIGRVEVSLGDRDCPPHIRLGRSVLPTDSEVKRDWLYVRDCYILQ